MAIDSVVPDLQDRLSEGEALAVSDHQGFRTELNTAGHRLVADEPADMGGTDQGPSPYGLLSAALASCTAMTLHLYAKAKKWPLQEIRVLVRHSKAHEKDCEECETNPKAMVDRLERQICVEGDLGEDIRARLLQIAEKCPVHRTLQASVRVDTTLVAGR
jgi:putative redox protein